jgi:hypothetical protein
MVGYDRRPGASLHLDVALSSLFSGLNHGGRQMLGLGYRGSLSPEHGDVESR